MQMRNAAILPEFYKKISCAAEKTTQLLSEIYDLCCIATAFFHFP